MSLIWQIPPNIITYLLAGIFHVPHFHSLSVLIQILPPNAGFPTLRQA